MTLTSHSAEEDFYHNASPSTRNADFVSQFVPKHRSWYTTFVAKPEKPIKLDVATGLAWLQAFVEKTHVVTANWFVEKLDDTFRYQGLPDEVTARKLARFLAAQYRVEAHVYEPMGSRWQVVVMHK